MLFALHPQLTPRRYAAALVDALSVAGDDDGGTRFASTLATFERLQRHLAEFVRSLPDEEQQALTFALLAEEDAESLLSHLLISSSVAEDATAPGESDGAS
jgi:hypothetical protein